MNYTLCTAPTDDDGTGCNYPTVVEHWKLAVADTSISEKSVLLQSDELNAQIISLRAAAKPRDLVPCSDCGGWFRVSAMVQPTPNPDAMPMCGKCFELTYPSPRLADLAFTTTCKIEAVKNMESDDAVRVRSIVANAMKEYASIVARDRNETLPRTADGVPMYPGMPVFDSNGQSLTITTIHQHGICAEHSSLMAKAGRGTMTGSGSHVWSTLAAANRGRS